MNKEKRNKRLFLKSLIIGSLVGYFLTGISSFFALFGKGEFTFLGFPLGEILLNLAIITLGISLLILSDFMKIFNLSKGGITSKEIFQVVTIIVGSFAIASGVLSFFDIGEITSVAINIIKLVESILGIIIISLLLMENK